MVTLIKDLLDLLTKDNKVEYVLKARADVDELMQISPNDEQIHYYNRFMKLWNTCNWFLNLDKHYTVFKHERKFIKEKIVNRIRRNAPYSWRMN